MAGGAAPAVVPVPTSGPYGNGDTGIDTKIIRTADVTLEVKDIPGTVELLKAVAVAQGGTSLQQISRTITTTR